MNKIEAVKEIYTTGNSLVISITKEVRMMGISKGDKIKVTIEKVD